jgi:hypothetical protein
LEHIYSDKSTKQAYYWVKYPHIETACGLIGTQTCKYKNNPLYLGQVLLTKMEAKVFALAP